MNNKYEQLFLEFSNALQTFLAEVDRKRLNNKATDKWDVKDVLGHITFWHMYYAQQYEALAKGKEPYVHRSLAGKNEVGRKKMRYVTKKELINMLKEAHEKLRTSILVKKVPKMMYMKSREYTTNDFLEVVTGHIKRHTLQVRRAKQLG
jgi:hypothetical protein